MSHMGAAGRLLTQQLASRRCRKRPKSNATYPAMQQLMVWSCQPWVSRMPRDRQRTMGATTQAQMNCQTIEGHHSQPLPCFMAISPGVLPVTSVPGMPKSGWNLREMR